MQSVHFITHCETVLLKPALGNCFGENWKKIPKHKIISNFAWQFYLCLIPLRTCFKDFTAILLVVSDLDIASYALWINQRLVTGVTLSVSLDLKKTQHVKSGH